MLNLFTSNFFFQLYTCMPPCLVYFFKKIKKYKFVVCGAILVYKN